MNGGDEQATSFGDPNARPPTPPRFSTSAVFSSPLLVTPERNSGQSDEATGWTPRFAEDYSVFNSTPGNLRGTSVTAKLDLAPPSPLPPSTGRKRPLSAEGLALELSTHANHFSLNPEKLPPVDAARRLLSSDISNPTHEGAISDPNATTKASQLEQSQRSAKKYRGCTTAVAAGKDARPQETQTATPPPSSQGGRKLAPRLETDKMQNQSFGQPDFSSAQTPQQHQINGTFVSGSPEDVFSYPMGGPATTPPIAGARSFWGMSMDTSGMGIDVDLSAAGAELFQTTPTQDPSRRAMDSSDWGRANQMFQQQDMSAHPQPPQQQEQHRALQQSQSQNNRPNQSAKRERRLAPKTAQMMTPKAGQSGHDQRYSLGSFQMSMDDPFSTSPGGVDPGLVFSQMSASSPLKADAMSTSMSMSMDLSPQRPTSLAPAELPQSLTSENVEQTVSKAHMPVGDIRRTGSTGGRNQRKQLDRAAISPTKNSAGRPGLSRSFSESARGGKRTVGASRQALPALAPARPVTVHQPSLPPPVTNQNHQSQLQGPRSTGRRSPLKSSHHHRLSSLSSIPENGANARARQRSATRASVKFVIDDNGRARAETVVDEDEPEPLIPISSQQSGFHNPWGGLPDSPEDDGYPSSSDDEPIIIPSRSTSFNYPEPPKSSSSASIPPIFALRNPMQGRLRSNSDRPSLSTASLHRNTRMDPDSSMADHMDMDQSQQQQPSRPSTGSSLGDAAAELRKVMQAGILKGPAPLTAQQQQQQQQQQQAVGSGGSSGHRQRFISGQRSSSSTISEASLPTPSPTHNQNQGHIRCVCNRPEVDGAVFLVKCDSCEYLLHGRCVDLHAAQDVPHVYICAFCANTPMRGGRLRYSSRNNNAAGLGSARDDDGMMGPPVSVTASSLSPLAHKSFRSFR